jgi:hypothetical protein
LASCTHICSQIEHHRGWIKPIQFHSLPTKISPPYNSVVTRQVSGTWDHPTISLDLIRRSHINHHNILAIAIDLDSAVTIGFDDFANRVVVNFQIAVWGDFRHFLGLEAGPWIQHKFSL